MPIGQLQRRAAQTCRSTQRLLGLTFANVSLRFLYAYFDAWADRTLHNFAVQSAPRPDIYTT